MFKKEKYDPVTALVPGVDPIKRKEEIIELSLAGDMQPPKELPKQKVIFNFKRLGIKIIR